MRTLLRIFVVFVLLVPLSFCSAGSSPSAPTPVGTTGGEGVVEFVVTPPACTSFCDRPIRIQDDNWGPEYRLWVWEGTNQVSPPMEKQGDGSWKYTATRVPGNREVGVFVLLGNGEVSAVGFKANGVKLSDSLAVTKFILKPPSTVEAR